MVDERFTESDSDYLSEMGVEIETAEAAMCRLLFMKNSELMQERAMLTDLLSHERSQHASAVSERDAMATDAKEHMSQAKKYELMFWGLFWAVLAALILAALAGALKVPA